MNMVSIIIQIILALGFLMFGATEARFKANGG